MVDVWLGLSGEGQVGHQIESVGRAPGPEPQGSRSSEPGGEGPVREAGEQGGRPGCGGPGSRGSRVRKEAWLPESAAPQTVLSLAAARDQAREEYKATAEQAVSVRQQAAVRASPSLSLRKPDAPGCGQDFPRMAGGLALWFKLNAMSSPSILACQLVPALFPLKKVYIVIPLR